jgi:uncharacterized protein (TIGR02001 family)
MDHPGTHRSGIRVAARVAGTLALACCPGLVGAQVLDGARLSFDVALTSDHVVQGVTRSEGEPALQGHVGVGGEAGWVVGVWASRADSGAGSNGRYEIDPYIGKRWLLGQDWSVSADVTRYLYRPASSRSYDYTELRSAVTYGDMLEFAIAWAPDYSGYSWLGRAHDRTMLSYEAAARLPATRWLTLTAGAGRRDLQDVYGKSYWYWSAGSQISVHRISLALTYIGSSRGALDLYGADDAGDRLVATIVLRVL